MRPPSRARLTLLLAAMTAFPPMAIDQYLPALPGIGRELGASPAAVQLTLSLFFVGFSVGQLVYGPLSDSFGRRRPLLAGIVLFIVASVLCATTHSIAGLILWRVAQSVGAAAGSVIARAMVRDLFAGSEAARMLSLMALVMGVAPLGAPILGGYLTEWFGWASNFWALAAFGAACLAGAAIGLPESLPAAQRRPARLVAVLRDYARLVADRGFMRYALAGGFSFGGYFAYVSGSPFVFIELFGVPVAGFGYLFGLNVLGMMAGSAANSRLVDRVGLGRMLWLGLIVAAVAGLALVACAATGAGGFWGLFAAIFLFIAMQGLITANAMAGALSAVAPDRAGTAAALAGVAMFLVGAAAGAAVDALFDGTARPMAAVIAACALAALAVAALPARPVVIRYRRGSP